MRSPRWFTSLRSPRFLFTGALLLGGAASQASPQTTVPHDTELADADRTIRHARLRIDGTGPLVARPTASPGASTAGGRLGLGGPDSLTTQFTGSVRANSTFFDITPVVNLRLTAVDVHNSEPVGTLVDVDVFYRLGSSVGSEEDPAGWNLLASGLSLSAGVGLPTPVQLPGADFVFKAGVTYGLAVSDPSLPVEQRIDAGPATVFANEDLSLTTNSASLLPLFGAGSNFPNFIFNGTLHYETVPTLNVAIAGSERNAPWLSDVQNKLEATGKFNSIDILDVRTATPSLGELMRYDAILAWSDSHYLDRVSLGDTLADYVDAGGGVVVAVFANSDLNPARRLSGRWLTDGYEVVVGAGGTTVGAATLGAVALPAHPVMKGVTSFAGGSSSYRPTATALTPGSSLIASWSDGKVLAAEGRPGRIDLGFFPPSDDQRSDFWDAATDGDQLMANALCAAAGRKPRVLVAANSSWRIEVQAKLIASEKFSAVDTFDTRVATPTLAELRSYGSVLVFNEAVGFNGPALGDVLADYVDAGGGVVLAMLTVSNRPLAGRWATGGYEVILSGRAYVTGAAGLGAVHLPGHPVMAGVASFSGGTSSFRPITTALQAGATSIAEWSDGRVLVAEGANRQRVDLGFFPPSSDSRADFWDATTDGVELMCNSLLYVSERRPRVMVATSDTAAGGADVAAKLRGTGEFATVDVFDASVGTPTLAQLRAYDGVLCYSNFGLADPVAMGDVLADYVDAGGGVLSAFAAQVTGSFAPAGRWATGGHELLVVTGIQFGNPATLGLVNEPLHPVMQGVATFDGGPQSFRLASTILQPGARSVAEWTDGTVLIAAGATSRRIDMNAFAFSSDASSSGWVASSDGARLMANALLFVSRGVGGEVGTTYCTAGTTSDGCNASISAWGRPSVSKAAGFLIEVSNMPGNKNGILFYGLNGPNSAPWGNSTSFLCVKAPTQRMGLLSSGGTPGTCEGVFQLDWLDYVATHPGRLGVPFSPGCGVWVQAWFRDPAAGTGPVGAKGTATSNGLFFVTQP